MEQDNRPLVTVICTSYNHEKFIKECLDGFVIQQTNFPFEVIVHDDASTDNTQQIVKEYESKYPDLFNNIYQIENQFSKKEFDIWCDVMFPKAKGKYIAICDGDDYWTDPLKLQKQVNHLEANPEYGMVHADSLVYNENNGEFEVLKKLKNKYDSFFEELMFGNAHIYTLTVCFRKELLLAYTQEIEPLSKNWLMGDLPLWLFISNRSKVCFMNELMSVYRIQEESASNTKDINKYLAFIESTLKIRLFFLEKYCNDNLELRKYLISAYFYQRLVGNITFKGDFKQFLNFLCDFYLNNNNMKLFFGSFYQILKKIKSHIMLL
jgi:glycosyltransferase involved in cell wall biosynthesis